MFIVPVRSLFTSNFLYMEQIHMGISWRSYLLFESPTPPCSFTQKILRMSSMCTFSTYINICPCFYIYSIVHPDTMQHLSTCIINYNPFLHQTPNFYRDIWKDLARNYSETNIEVLEKKKIWGRYMRKKLLRPQKPNIYTDIPDNLVQNYENMMSSKCVHTCTSSYPYVST